MKTAEKVLWEDVLTQGDTEPYGHVPIPKIYQAMQRFAKLHVEAALDEAAMIADMWENSGQLAPEIKKAYSVENIK